MASGCDDADAVGFVEDSGIDNGDVPAGRFSDVVAALTGTAAVAIAGGPVVGMAGDVINMPDQRPAEGIPTGLVAQFDQVGEPAGETAAAGIPPTIGPFLGAVKSRRHHLRPLEVITMSRARSPGSGP